MAARTGAGTGVVVALVVFVLSTVFLLVLTIVFYSKQAAALDQRDQAVAELDKFATRTQRNSDSFKAVLTDAGSSRDSAMQYLLEQQAQTMQKVLGNRDASPAELQTTLARYYPENPNASYETVLRDLSGDVRAARSEAEGLQTQIAELQNLIREKEALLADAQASSAQEVQAVRDLIGTFMGDVQTYGVNVQTAIAEMRKMVDELDQAYQNDVARLESDLDAQRADLALKDQQLAEVQSILDLYQLKSADPAQLVDGRVMDNPTSEGQIYIDRGTNDHIVMGMTFEVYDNASMLASTDQFGSVPQGKASVQVINVGPATSTAKITRTSRGRPVVKGDVIANAVYDPDKKFMFLVHGKFDLDLDGRPTEAETQQVKNLITQWGGEVVESDRIRGDMDFLLLGQQPVKPLDPPNNPTPGQMDIWLQQMKAYDTYNQLLADAMKADIPVLNQNRFYILIGHTPQ